jgi:hypothetical protein
MADRLRGWSRLHLEKVEGTKQAIDFLVDGVAKNKRNLH